MKEDQISKRTRRMKRNHQFDCHQNENEGLSRFPVFSDYCQLTLDLIDQSGICMFCYLFAISICYQPHYGRTKIVSGDRWCLCDKMMTRSVDLGIIICSNINSISSLVVNYYTESSCEWVY